MFRQTENKNMFMFTREREHGLFSEEKSESKKTSFMFIEIAKTCLMFRKRELAKTCPIFRYRESENMFYVYKEKECENMT